MDLTAGAKLSSGATMPWIGLGTWQSEQGAEAYESVLAALRAGYRHIDTAAVYGNEESVGRAIKDSGVPRKEIFVTTKLWNTDHANPRAALQESLNRLQLDYIDLYLIHWPVPQRNESWKILEELYHEGKAKSIGVSNFTERHLKELMEQSDVVPAVNQFEFSPFLYQKELLEFCQQQGIQPEAYCPLARAGKFNNPVLKEIAQKHQKTPAQVMLRWSLRHGLVVIPKSVREERIIENASLDFELDDEDMQQLDSLNEGLRNCPDPYEMP